MISAKSIEPSIAMGTIASRPSTSELNCKKTPRTAGTAAVLGMGIKIIEVIATIGAIAMATNTDIPIDEMTDTTRLMTTVIATE